MGCGMHAAGTIRCQREQLQHLPTALHMLLGTAKEVKTTCCCSALAKALKAKALCDSECVSCYRLLQTLQNWRMVLVNLQNMVSCWTASAAPGPGLVRFTIPQQHTHG
jgi:hypothetical protein